MKLERKAQRAFERKIQKLARKSKVEPIRGSSRLPVIVRMPIAKTACSLLWIVSSFFAQLGLWIAGMHKQSRIWDASNALSSLGLDLYDWGRTGRTKKETEKSIENFKLQSLKPVDKTKVDA